MRVAGIMSGTSVDAVDVAVCEFEPLVDDAPCSIGMRLLGFAEQPFPPVVRQRVLNLVRARTAPLDDLAELNFLLGDVFADALEKSVRELGLSVTDLDLIASHGQTIYHLVDPERRKSTLQMGESSVVAHRTGVSVASDFRTADMAAGGEGAPLVSFFDALFFGDPMRTRAIQNIGGIANVTFVPAGENPEEVYAFDTGPGNALIDCGARHFSGGREQFDRDGRMAQVGTVDWVLLGDVLSDRYFARKPPKSTGREDFGDTFALDIIQKAEAMQHSPENIMATLTAVTSESIVRAYRDFGPEKLDEVIVSGGGARNPAIIDGIRRGLSRVSVRSHDEFGVPADAKEAVAFALLGHEMIHGRPANLPRCTGASARSVLGKLTPGENYQQLMRSVYREAASAEAKIEGISTCPTTRKLRLTR